MKIKRHIILAITSSILLFLFQFFGCGYKRCMGYFLNDPKILSIMINSSPHETANWQFPLHVKTEIQEQLLSFSSFRLAKNEQSADATINIRVINESVEPLSSYDIQTHSLTLSKYSPKFTLQLDIIMHQSNKHITITEKITEEYFPRSKISEVEAQKNIANIHAAKRISKKIIEKLVTCN